MTIWECKIGFPGDLPANAVLRLATRGLQRIIGRKFAEIMGRRADFAFCNVGDLLTLTERTSAEVVGPATVFHYKIGLRDDVALPDGADYPIRQVAGMMFDALFRKDSTFNFSGWGGKLTESELRTISETAV